MVDQNDVAWAYHRLLRYARPPSDLTFRQFVAQLSPHLRANEHWRPQIDFLVYLEYDDMFCFENFAQMTTVLHEKIDFTLHDARSLSKHGTDHYFFDNSGKCVADISALELLCLKRAGKIPNLTSFYDDNMIKIVTKMFYEDILLYESTGNRKTIFSKRS
jgi:hypothetical protein